MSTSKHMHRGKKQFDYRFPHWNKSSGKQQRWGTIGMNLMMVRNWKNSPKKVAAYKRRWGQIGIAPAARGDMANVDDERERAHMTDQINLNTLQEIRKSTFADKLQKARKTLASQQGKLKEMRRTKVRGQRSISSVLTMGGAWMEKILRRLWIMPPVFLTSLQ